MRNLHKPQWWKSDLWLKETTLKIQAMVLISNLESLCLCYITGQKKWILGLEIKVKAWTLNWGDYLGLPLYSQYNRVFKSEKCRQKGLSERWNMRKTWFSISSFEDEGKGPWAKKCSGLWKLEMLLSLWPARK